MSEERRNGGTGSLAGDTLTGRRLARVEDRSLLTGSAEFVDDLHFPGLLHARFVRSPYAHARIIGASSEAARALPGVLGAFTSADLDVPPLVTPIENPDAHAPSRPLLAGEIVRFAGEAIALVVADSPYTAEDAAALVDVEYEPLGVVSDPATAVESAPIHEHPTNVLLDARTEAGEVDAMFADAAVVVERTIRSARYNATPMEPRGVVAVPDADGVRIWSSSQAPHSLADLVALMLGLPRASVRVAAPFVGGGFGQKAHAYPEEIVLPWAALRLGRPVKWIEDRSENLLSSSHARDQIIQVRAAADADGRLLAMDADVTCDTGAYAIYPHGHILEALGTPAMIPGPYRLRHYRARARAVATNKCPEGAYRGVGLPVAVLVHERVMDALADELGIDRAEIRRRNYVGADEMPYTSITGQRYDSGDYREALDRALNAIDYTNFAARQREARETGRLLGLGIASYVEYTGVGSATFHGRGMVGIPGNDRAWITFDSDGRATVATTLPDMGQGVRTTFAQIAADALGLGMDDVVIAPVDTAAGEGSGTGTFASRSAIVGGGAIVSAAEDLRGRLLRDAAEELAVGVSELELRGRRVVVRGSPDRSIALTELTARASEPYTATASFDPSHVMYPYATHACIVEVDGESGHVVLKRYVVAEDCGRLINPMIAEGQTHGAVAQGIGGALLESLVYDGDGQLLTASLMDYLVPTAGDVPHMELLHIESTAPNSPTGAKGVGEGGTLASGPVIASAVSDALGVEMNELPLTPERVREAARSELRGAVAVGG